MNTPINYCFVGLSLALSLFGSAAAGPLEDGNAAFDRRDYAQAAVGYRTAADQGNALAQYNLGLLYDSGRGVPQSYDQAAVWYRKAADQGMAEAMSRLGYMYQEGRGVRQDYALALNWHRKGAELGNALSQFNLGYLYLNGFGVPQDDAMAEYWYQKAHKQGLQMAVVFLDLLQARKQVPPAVKKPVQPVSPQVGIAAVGPDDLEPAFRRGDYATVLRIIRPEADRGSANAQALLATMYDEGKGVPQSYSQAAFWYRKAADQGLVEAQNTLGFRYRDGRGVPQDYAQGAAWFRKAADQGNAEAQYALGVMYGQGRGVPLDFVQAYKWMSLAAQRETDAASRAKALKARDMAASILTPAQLAEAQRLTREWRAR